MDETKLTSELPERIWLIKQIARLKLNRDYYVSDTNFRGDDVEYVRADLATPAPQYPQSAVDRIAALEAENKALHEKYDWQDDQL